jgi:O-acetylhomoserine (thiol)-lyase
MHDETLALHVGFDADPVTRAVAVPICGTAAYQSDSAGNGAALAPAKRSRTRVAP